jgi:molybdopterin-guanine dinucleotide biosynthesis protein A
LEGLIAGLKAKGLRVAAVKHCRHVDRRPSGKDSDRLADSGAEPAIAVAAGGAEVRGGREQALLPDLLTTFCRACDLVLAEGYRGSVYDKILLAGGRRSRPPGRVEGVRLAVIRPDAEALLGWVLSWLAHRRAMREGLIAAVLAGGASRRMGTDKSALTIGPRRVLGRLSELLADRIGQVMIVGGKPDRRGIPASVAWHPDIRPGLGPLGGIATALRVAAASDPPKAVCVAACDLAGLGGEMLDLLLAARNRQAPATAPTNPETGRIEPLLAVYEPSALRSIEAALDSGKLSVTEWLTAAKAHLLAVPTDLAGQLENVNTPEALEAMRLRLEANGTWRSSMRPV